MGHKQKVLGKENIVAGRDVIINATELSEKISEIYDQLLKPAFARIDRKIVNLFPDGLSSPTSPEKQQNFSCEKLFESLTFLGLPIRITLQAIAEVEAHFSKLPQPFNSYFIIMY